MSNRCIFQHTWFLNPLFTMGLLASPFYKHSLNDQYFVIVYAREKMLTVLKRREAELYGDVRCFMIAQIIHKLLFSEHRRENSAYHNSSNIWARKKFLQKAEKTSLYLYGAALECTSNDGLITGKY